MITTTTQKIATVLAVLVVIAAAGGIAQAATSKPSGMSQAEYRALMARSAGLNERYRLGAWKGVPEGLSPAEYRALTLRSEALNKQYGLGKWSAAAKTNVSTHGFAWGAFGIGAVAMLGLRPGRRRGRRQPAWPRSPSRQHLVAAPQRANIAPGFPGFGRGRCRLSMRFRAGCYPSARPQSRLFACASSRRAWIAESL